MHTHTASLLGHRHTVIAILLFAMTVFLFSYTGHAEAKENTSVDQQISSLLSTTNLVLSVVNERVGTDQALAAGTNSEDAEIQRLTKLLNELIATYEKLISQQKQRGTGDPSIRVTYPNGGEYLTIGERGLDFEVTWVSTNLGGTAEVYLNAANGYLCLLGRTPVSAGKYVGRVSSNHQCDYFPSGIVNGQYKILIATDTSNPNGDQKGINDKSDNYFTLSNSGISDAQTESGAPVIRSFKPTTAVAEKSNTFVISGRNFDRYAVVHYKNSATGYSGTVYPAAAQNTEIIFAIVPGRQGYVEFYVQNPDGTKSNTEQVKIASADGSFAKPSVTISAYPTQVASGEKATITWSATQADSCNMDGEKQGTWGSVSRTVRTSETYTVECTGAGGTTKKSVTVGVTQGEGPVIKLTPSVDQHVSYGGTMTFEWSVTPTKGVTCEAAGNGVNGKSWGEIALSGKWTTPKLYANTTYGMKCTDTAGRSVYKYIDLNITKQSNSGTEERPSISVSPRDASVAYGKTATLEWSVTPTSGTTCEAAGTGVNGATGKGAVALSGKWTTPKLYANTTYGIRCTNSAGTEVKYVEVRVAEQKNEDTQPEITYVYPTHVSVGQATSFTIMGKNFATDATIGYSNSETGYGGTLTPTRVNSNSIILDITPSAKGEITFYVKHKDGKTSNTKSVIVQ